MHRLEENQMGKSNVMTIDRSKKELTMPNGCKRFDFIRLLVEHKQMKMLHVATPLLTLYLNCKK